MSGGALSDPAQQKFLTAVLADLKKSGGKCAVVVGPQSSAAAQAAALSLNSSLGAVGKTVMYTETVAAIPSEQTADF